MFISCTKNSIFRIFHQAKTNSNRPSQVPSDQGMKNINECEKNIILFKFYQLQ